MFYFTEKSDCGPDEFVCGDGSCISMDWVCDGVTDCANLMDEQNCSMFIDCKIRNYLSVFNKNVWMEITMIKTQIFQFCMLYLKN